MHDLEREALETAQGEAYLGTLDSDETPDPLTACHNVIAVCRAALAAPQAGAVSLLACDECCYTGSTHGTGSYLAGLGVGASCPNCGKGTIAEFRPSTSAGAVSADRDIMDVFRSDEAMEAFGVARPPRGAVSAEFTFMPPDRVIDQHRGRPIPVTVTASDENAARVAASAEAERLHLVRVEPDEWVRAGAVSAEEPTTEYLLNRAMERGSELLARAEAAEQELRQVRQDLALANEGLESAVQERDEEHARAEAAEQERDEERKAANALSADLDRVAQGREPRELPGPYRYALTFDLVIRGDGQHADGDGAVATERRLRAMLEHDHAVEAVRPGSHPEHMIDPQTEGPR